MRLIEQYKEGLKVLESLPSTPPIHRYVREEIISKPLDAANNTVYRVHYRDEKNIQRSFIKKVYSNDDSIAMKGGILFNGFANTLRFGKNEKIQEHTMRLLGAHMTRQGEFVLYLEDALPGDLESVLKTINPSDDSEYALEALKSMAAILKPLAALHTAGIVHGDVKPKNFVLVADDNGHRTVKAIDLDSATYPAQEAIHLSNNHTTDNRGGTFVPGEAALDTHYYPNFTTDVFAAAYTFYHLLTGIPTRRGFCKTAIQNFLSECSSPALKGPDTLRVAQMLKETVQAYPQIEMSQAALSRLPNSIQTILLTAASKNSSERYPNAMRMLQAIEHEIECIMIQDMDDAGEEINITCDLAPECPS